MVNVFGLRLLRKKDRFSASLLLVAGIVVIVVLQLATLLTSPLLTTSTVGGSNAPHDALREIGNVNSIRNDTDERTSTLEKDEAGNVSSDSATAKAGSVSMINKTGGFIHIGKTGGSSLTAVIHMSCHSFVKQLCQSHVIPNETIVSELITDYYHFPDVLKIPESKQDFYIVSTRDPFERFGSAFCYTHPQNQKARNQTSDDRSLRKRNIAAYKCFPTLESFAMALGRNIGECTNHARASIAGNVTDIPHLWGNYQKYAENIPSQADVYVVRNERKWKDWAAVNKMFDPSREIVVPEGGASHTRDLSTVQQPVTRNVSDEGRSFLCKSLESEYAIYFRLLERAANIDEKDIEEARNLRRMHCPSSTSNAANYLFSDFSTGALWFAWVLMGVVWFRRRLQAGRGRRA